VIMGKGYHVSSKDRIEMVFFLLVSIDFCRESHWNLLDCQQISISLIQAANSRSTRTALGFEIALEFRSL
jgi:hypothetical protein